MDAMTDAMIAVPHLPLSAFLADSLKFLASFMLAPFRRLCGLCILDGQPGVAAE